VARGMPATRAQNFVMRAKGDSPVDILADVQAQMRGDVQRQWQKAPATLAEAIRQQRRAAAEASLGGTPRTPAAVSAETPLRTPRVGEDEPFVSKVANRYTAERMASGELGQVDPSTGKSTEEMVMQGLKMAPEQRERLINNFSRGVGGDLDNQGAAIRSKEAILIERSSAA